MPKKGHSSISFQLPNDYTLPEFYETATPKEIAEALTIGSCLFTTVKTASTNTKIKEIEEAKDKEIAVIHEESKQKLKTVTDSLQKTEELIQALRLEKIQQIQAFEKTIQDTAHSVRTAEREQTGKLFEQKIKSLEQDIDSLKAKNDAYLARKLELEANRDKDIQTTEELTRRSLNDLIAEKDRSLKQARLDLEATNSRNERALGQLHELIRIQTDELRNLKDGITKRSANVKSKGNDFEDGFRLKLIASYGTSEHFSLEDTAKNGLGHAGDFIMNWKDHKILWETKDYDKTVPEEEVKKFKRDIKENPETNIGVMVSKHTGITGKTAKGDLHHEFVEGKLLMYISNFDRMSDELLPLLMMFFKMYWKNGQKLEEDDGKINAIREIEKLNKTIEEKKKEWRVHKAHQESALRFTSEFVEEMENKVRYLLNDLQGTVEKLKDIPPNIFRDCLGDESSIQKIQTILSCVEHDPDSTVELNKLADAYVKARGNLTIDTAKSHIKSVLLDTAIIANKGKMPTKVIGLVLSEMHI